VNSLKIVSDHLVMAEQASWHSAIATRGSRALLSCDRSEPLPTCQAILNVIGDFLADSCQVEEFLRDEGIFGLAACCRK
jgi:hypothetical protein